MNLVLVKGVGGEEGNSSFIEISDKSWDFNVSAKIIYLKKVIVSFLLPLI